MRATLFLALIAAASSGGCGLNRNGTGPAVDDAGVGDDDGPSVRDATQDHPIFEAAADVTEESVGSCVARLPSGWSLIYYEPTLGLCPSNFANHDVVSNPQAMTTACFCQCGVTAQPSCTNGTLNSGYGPACAIPGQALTIAGIGCNTINPTVAFPGTIAEDPIGLTGGTCTGTPQGDTSQVTMTAGRMCEIPALDEEVACESTPPTGFATCLVAPGDVSCPAGSAYGMRTVVADQETLVCSACTTCTVSGTCGAAEVNFYTDPGCASDSLIQTVPANKSCTNATSKGAMIAGVSYSADPSPTCMATGTTPSFQAANAETICCK